MSTSSGGFVELDAKFLESNDQTFRVFLVDAEKSAVFLHSTEVLGRWKTAKAGDIIKIRISQRHADESGVLGTHTYGTGKSGGKSIGGTPLMG